MSDISVLSYDLPLAEIRRLKVAGCVVNRVFTRADGVVAYVVTGPEPVVRPICSVELSDSCTACKTSGRPPKPPTVT